MSTPLTVGTTDSLTWVDGSRGVNALERLAREPDAHNLLEVRARDDVLVRARQGVLDGHSGGLLGDAPSS
jgi:hypothetical protein